jgi:hypothetical protein
LWISFGNFTDLTQEAVVEDQSVELAKFIDSCVDGLLGQRKVCQVTIHHFNLLAVLLLELLKRLDTAGHHYHIMGLRCCEQIIGHSKTNA